MRAANSCLVLGIAGVGKSTLVKELVNQGKDAHDADLVPGLGQWHDPTGQPVPWQGGAEWCKRHIFYWTTTGMAELFATRSPDKTLYLAGISQNAFTYAAPLFERVVFLDASAETIVDRRLSPDRSTPYPIERSYAETLENVSLLRANAQEIGAVILDAERDVSSIAAHIISLAESEG